MYDNSPKKNKINTLAYEIDYTYNKDPLLKMYSLYLSDFISTYKAEFKRNGIGTLAPVNKIKKQDFVDLVVTILEDDDLCTKFLSFLPTMVIELLNILVWESDLSMKSINERLYTPGKKKEIFEAISRGNEHYFPFVIFYYPNFRYSRPDNMELNLYIPKAITKILKKYIPPPPEYNIISVDNKTSTAFVYNNVENALTELGFTLNFFKQGYLKYGKNDKPLMSSVRQMAQLLESKDFYDGTDKDLAFLKVKLMIGLLECSAPNLIKNKDSELDKLSKDIVSSLNDSEYSLIENICSHLKSKDKTWALKDEDIISKIIPIFKKFPKDGWVSANNLVRYITYRDIDLYNSINFRYFYIFYADIKYSNWKEKFWLKSRDVKYIVTDPLIKGIFFLFASFGWLEIAYDLPVSEKYKVYGKPYISIFDGAKYARLTKLGEFVFGITDTYKSLPSKKKDSQIILDNNRLILTFNGNNKLKKMIVADMMERINDDCYKMTFETFLMNCNTEENIKNKIETFKNLISSNIPKIWADFFKKAVTQINPITQEKDLFVYKLGDDKKLLHLVATDPILKKYILKVEGFRMALTSGNLKKVKKRLGELGYFTID